MAQQNKLAQWSIGRVYLFNIIFATIIALVIWIAIPNSSNPGFFNNWVHAQAIGNIICSLVLLSNSLNSRFNLLSDKFRILILPASIIAGFYMGTFLARFILQLPLNSSQISEDKHLLIVSITITVLVTIIINWFFTTQSTISRLRLKTAEESERATQAHLTMLLAQIEPHMLFNTLANVRTLVNTDPSKAQSMLDQLIEFLRTTLRHSRSASGTLKSEFQIVDNYLGIMAIRLGDRLRYSLVLPDELENCSVPSLLLQPLVENAIKHGIEPNIEGGKMTVSAAANENMLLLYIEDSGIGMSNTQITLLDADPKSTGSGYGLTNVRARIAALDGSCEIVSPLPNGARGTRVVLQLPVHYTELIDDIALSHH